MSSIEGYLTVEEAAAILGVSCPQARRYARDKQIPAKKIGHIFLLEEQAVRTFQRIPRGNPAFVKSSSKQSYNDA